MLTYRQQGIQKGQRQGMRQRMSWTVFALAIVFILTNANCARAHTPNAASHSLFVPILKSTQESNQPPEGDAPGDSLPAEVVGTWFAGDLLPLNFYDTTTGHWETPNGVGEMYIFNADGTFTYTGFARVQYQQCTGSVSVYREGRATEQDAHLILTPNTAKTRTVTACGSGDDSTTDGPYDPKQVAWSLAHDKFGKLELTLTVDEITKPFSKIGMVSELVGTWQNGQVTSVGFYDPATQTFGTPAGAGKWLRIHADGSYQAGEYDFATDMNNCQLTGWVYQEGELSVSGGLVTLRPTSGMARVENGCTPDQPQQEPWTDEDRSYTWLFWDWPASPKLVLIPQATFVEIVYNPE